MSALVEVHVQDGVAEDRDAVGVGLVAVLDDAAAGHLFGVEPVAGRVVLVDALHGALIDTGSVLRADARFSDHCDASTKQWFPGETAFKR